MLLVFRPRKQNKQTPGGIRGIVIKKFSQEEIVSTAVAFLFQKFLVKCILSEQKEILQKDICNWEVSDEMPPDLVHNMHNGIYHGFPYENFRTK